MANIKQQRKRVKITERERKENIRYKSRIKTMFRSLSEAAGKDDEKAAQLALELNSLIDRAAGMRIIHPNNAARKKAKVAAMVALPQGTGLPRGADKSEAAEGRGSKAERRAERGKARRKKKTEARASAKARAEAAAAEPVEEQVPEEETGEETEQPAVEEAPAGEAVEEAPAGEAQAEPVEEEAPAEEPAEEEPAEEEAPAEE